MKKTVVIHQPDYLPWLGFFDRLIKADLFIVLDHVQFVSGTSRSWTHRDRIKTADGARWLSLSVRNAPLGTPINEMQLTSGRHWRDANVNLLRESYRAAAHFNEVFPRILALYGNDSSRLVDLTIKSIDMICDLLGIRIEKVLSSTLAPRGARNEMLVDLLSKCGASHYLSGQGARDYFEAQPFDEAGIEVVWQQFSDPVYPQLHGSFEPRLSAIDALLNCGAQHTREIIGSGT